MKGNLNTRLLVPIRGETSFFCFPQESFLLAICQISDDGFDAPSRLIAADKLLHLARMLLGPLPVLGMVAILARIADAG